MPQKSLTKREIEVAEAGFEKYEQVEEQLEAALQVAGSAGDPRVFIVLLDVEADGSNETQRAIELYVMGNMPIEMVTHVVPAAINRYVKEQKKEPSA